MNITSKQWFQIISGSISGLITGAALLQPLFGQDLTIDIVAGLGIANIILSSVGATLSGQANLVRDVAAMPGVARVSLDGQAGAALAQVAIDPAQPKVGAVSPDVRAALQNIAKGVLLFAVLAGSLFMFNPAYAQGTKPAAPVIDPLSGFRRFAVTDIQGALDDATAHDDTAAIACWSALLPIVSQANASILPKTAGAFSAIQKARDVVRGVNAVRAGVGPLAELKDKCAAIIMDTQAFLVKLGVLGGGAMVGLPF